MTNSDSVEVPSNETAEPNRPRRRRGFAVMDPDLVREIARRGGVAAHRVGTAHEFNTEEARAAGRKGGLASHSSSSRRNEEPGQD